MQTTGEDTAQRRPPSIGIVGAGLAALRCADVLLQHGCKVTIFEARDRIGGRVAQSEHLGHLVDLYVVTGIRNIRQEKLKLEQRTQLDSWNEEQPDQRYR